MQNCKQSGMQKSIAHSIATTFLIKIFNKKDDDIVVIVFCYVFYFLVVFRHLLQILQQFVYILFGKSF